MDATPGGVKARALFNILWILKLGERVFLELAIQRPLADAENFGRLAAVAAGLPQRPLDRGALPPGHRHAPAGHHVSCGGGGHGRPHHPPPPPRGRAPPHPAPPPRPRPPPP